MRVLVGMSGGVDSSVTAALLVDAGHQVVGATMKLWGGRSDSGCCSVGDVDDARRVAQQLGLDHHVFNFTEDFDRSVVDPYVADHAAGRTPNPCVACNRHLKFDRFVRRAVQLGFDAVATGHYARISRGRSGEWDLRRGQDPAKDQSYVLHMLGQDQLGRILLPLGSLTKTEVRRRAAGLGLRTAAKPDSQDVCFISRAGGRQAFLGDRIPLRSGRVVDRAGTEVGTVPAVELVTVGQRRGLGISLSGGLRAAGTPGGSSPTKADRRFVTAIDLDTATVTVGALADLLVESIAVGDMSWVKGAPPAGRRVQVQTSAHGQPVAATWDAAPSPDGASLLRLVQPVRRVAPGQSVVIYEDDLVLGGGTAV